MKNRLLPLVLATMIFTGCATPPKDVHELPNPEIQSADFRVGSDKTVHIYGLYFKEKSDNKSDVIASINLRNWAPAKKIISSNGTEYVVDLPYGPDFAQVWVRVYGINNHYSEPVIVGVKLR